MNDKNKKTNIDEEMEHSNVALKDAKILFENGSLEGAISRAYYAAFHAAQALLLTLGLEPKTHQGVGHLFYQHFIRGGVIEPKYSQILARAQKYREEADYRHTMAFTREQTGETISEVESFISCLKDILSSKGY